MNTSTTYILFGVLNTFFIILLRLIPNANGKVTRVSMYFLIGSVNFVKVLLLLWKHVWISQYLPHWTFKTSWYTSEKLRCLRMCLNVLFLLIWCSNSSDWFYTHIGRRKKYDTETEPKIYIFVLKKRRSCNWLARVISHGQHFHIFTSNNCPQKYT